MQGKVLETDDRFAHLFSSKSTATVSWLTDRSTVSSEVSTRSSAHPVGNFALGLWSAIAAAATTVKALKDDQRQ